MIADRKPREIPALAENSRLVACYRVNIQHEYEAKGILFQVRHFQEVRPAKHPTASAHPETRTRLS